MENLIEALRKSADDIENGDKHYTWSEGSECNCGILAQNVMGENARSLGKRGIHGGWSFGIGGKFAPHSLCRQTYTPVKQVLDKLYSLGLNEEDLYELEHLTNQQVLERMNIHGISRSNPEHVVLYMRAWADILCEKESLKQLKKC